MGEYYLNVFSRPAAGKCFQRLVSNPDILAIIYSLDKNFCCSGGVDCASMLIWIKGNFWESPNKSL